jgi:hypothetical protein
LLDRQGALIAPLSSVKRVNVPLSRIPRHVQAAFVAVEDRRFYSHHGIDWHGLARAAVENAKALGVREGASTITMQLARNVFLSHRANERSIPRKLLEWRYATLIEDALDKPTILERYLNAIYLGNGVYGVEGASRDLFGKSVKDITLAEAALLAGLPKAPSSNTPRNDPQRARNRRTWCSMCSSANRWHRLPLLPRPAPLMSATFPTNGARSDAPIRGPSKPCAPRSTRCDPSAQSRQDSTMGSFACAAPSTSAPSWLPSARSRRERARWMVNASGGASSAPGRRARRVRWWHSIRAPERFARSSAVAASSERLQSRTPGKAAARVGIQTVRVRRCAAEGLHQRLDGR